MHIIANIFDTLLVLKGHSCPHVTYQSVCGLSLGKSVTYNKKVFVGFTILSEV